ncbi:RNA 2',3'-cyclic phosphodiesterase [Kordiimonas pumila]|uniref:RNA 2',3'-cyclic phosphodiesterase n=1 Tax=Kordiimonas pumila TaxID=2161677 RepID=A0ABV7CZZ3_9PROT|nr:RNA 2',3'-cyclic phosphodiesterase [Kordiimonas pumila]
MTRLFVGIELSPLIQESLTLARGGVEGAYWQRDDQLHLTLAFIGEVSKRDMRDIGYELSRIHFDPFEMSLSGVGVFGKPGQPKALWAGVDNEAPFKHLHEKVLTAVERVVVETDRRRYKPHVTLARFPRWSHARIGDWLTVNGALRTPPQLVEHFTLFSSSQTAEGSAYRAEEYFGSGFMEEVCYTDEWGTLEAFA